MALRVLLLESGYDTVTGAESRMSVCNNVPGQMPLCRIHNSIVYRFDLPYEGNVYIVTNLHGGIPDPFAKKGALP